MRHQEMVVRVAGKGCQLVDTVKESWG